MRTDDTIICWGDAESPTGTFKTLAVGGHHTCATRLDDTITCWGSNTHGQSDVSAGTYKAIGAGETHTCAIRLDDTLACWGPPPAPDGVSWTIQEP